MNNEQLHDVEPKERIIDMARDRFFTHGFNKVTLDELSGELGISKKTMYKFFPSKDELVKTVVWLTLRMVERRIDAIAGSDRPLVHRLAELMLFMSRTVGRFSRSFVSDMQRFAPVLWKEIDRFRREHIVAKVVRLIRQAKEEGVLRPDIEEEIVVLMFVTCVQNIATPEVLANHTFSVREAMHTIFHIIFEGSLTDQAREEFRRYELTIND